MIFILLLSLIAIGASAEGPPVVVGVYIESLCPDSRAFILNQLTPTYSKLHSIISLELVPFGNANYKIVNKTGEQFDVEFTCQHGPQECLGNKIQSCAISTLPANTSLALVNCMFASADWKTPAKSGLECATSLKLDWNFLTECSSGPLGRGLELTMGERTNKLNPKQDWIPWITINGKHTKEIQTRAETQLLKLVCDSYTGTKPKECSA